MPENEKDQGITGNVIKARDITTKGNFIAGNQYNNVDTNEFTSTFDQWKQEIDAKIEELEQLSTVDREDLKEIISKINGEAAKGNNADPNRLENLVNTIEIMSSDIFEVAVKTLENPLAGIGLVLKKISAKAVELKRE